MLEIVSKTVPPLLFEDVPFMWPFRHVNGTQTEASKALELSCQGRAQKPKMDDCQDMEEPTVVNREKIIEMAREAGVMKLDDPPNIPFMYRFAALAYAAGQRDMRERAAGVCGTIRAVQNDGCDDGWEFGIEHGAKHCAVAIRALPIEGEKE